MTVVPWTPFASGTAVSLRVDYDGRAARAGRRWTLTASRCSTPGPWDVKNRLAFAEFRPGQLEQA